MKIICELNDMVILGKEGLSSKPPRFTARAIVKNSSGLYAVMYSAKFNLYSLPGGGIEDGEEPIAALKREILEETGCICDTVTELGCILENRACQDYTQESFYYIVTAEHVGTAQLTEGEIENKTEVQWHNFEDMVKLISSPIHDTVQRKYLQARDAAALNEYRRIKS